MVTQFSNFCQLYHQRHCSQQQLDCHQENSNHQWTHPEAGGDHLGALHNCTTSYVGTYCLLITYHAFSSWFFLSEGLSSSVQGTCREPSLIMLIIIIVVILVIIVLLSSVGLSSSELGTCREPSAANMGSGYSPPPPSSITFYFSLKCTHPTYYQCTCTTCTMYNACRTLSKILWLLPIIILHYSLHVYIHVMSTCTMRSIST